MKNKKGFTLIELLAVIVILALLVAVAIPAVTKYLNTSRKGVFADNAAAAISAVRNQTIIQGITGDTKYYKITENSETPGTAETILVNDLLEKQLLKSPWGTEYQGYVKVVATDTTEGGHNVTKYTYSIVLTDGSHCIYKTGNGEHAMEEKDVNDNAVISTGCPALKTS